MTIELAPGEIILKKAMANHMVHGMTHIGHLWLTNQRVFFCTRPLNFRQESLSFPLSAIERVELRNIFLIFNQGLYILDNTGNGATFSVWGRKHWAAAIEAAQQEQLGSPLV